MPIRPENRDRYPDDWAAISKRIRNERANGFCECRGECGADHEGRCCAPNRTFIVRHSTKPWLWRDAKEVFDAFNAGGEFAVPDFLGSPVKVVLTVAHLDHTPENCDDDNLMAMCQLCHNRYDADHRRATRRRTRDREAGQLTLLEADHA